MRSSLVMVLVAAMMVACTDDEAPGQPAPQDGGTQSDASGGGMDVSVDTPRPDGGAAPDVFDIFDAFSIPDGPIGTCIACVRDQCGTQVNQCLNDAACRAGLQCTLTMCSGAPMPDAACVLGCFMGDTAAALRAAQAFMCIFSRCGAVCAPGEGGLMGDSGNDGSQVDATQADTTPPEASTESGASDANPAADSGGSGD